MPTQESSTALAPINGEYMVKVREFDAAGKALELSSNLPTSSEFSTWSVMQQVVMLKKGPWNSQSVPDIVWGLAYARSIGADVMKGDLFPTGGGRWGTSNKFKIRMALATGNITGIQTSFKELPETFNGKKDIECTVTISVKGWDTPIKRTAKLSRWFKASNPNWVGNPEHMLELNTVAHACEYVPGAVQVTEDDERPPETPTTVMA